MSVSPAKTVPDANMSHNAVLARLVTTKLLLSSGHIADESSNVPRLQMTKEEL